MTISSCEPPSFDIANSLALLLGVVEIDRWARASVVAGAAVVARVTAEAIKGIEHSDLVPSCSLRKPPRASLIADIVATAAPAWPGVGGWKCGLSCFTGVVVVVFDASLDDLSGQLFGWISDAVPRRAAGVYRPMCGSTGYSALTFGSGSSADISYRGQATHPPLLPARRPPENCLVVAPRCRHVASAMATA